MQIFSYNLFIIREYAISDILNKSKDRIKKISSQFKPISYSFESNLSFMYLQFLPPNFLLYFYQLLSSIYSSYIVIVILVCQRQSFQVTVSQPYLHTSYREFIIQCEDGSQLRTIQNGTKLTEDHIRLFLDSKKYGKPKQIEKRVEKKHDYDVWKKQDGTILQKVPHLQKPGFKFIKPPSKGEEEKFYEIFFQNKSIAYTTRPYVNFLLYAPGSNKLFEFKIDRIKPLYFWKKPILSQNNTHFLATWQLLYQRTDMKKTIVYSSQKPDKTNKFLQLYQIDFNGRDLGLVQRMSLVRVPTPLLDFGGGVFNLRTQLFIPEANRSTLEAYNATKTNPINKIKFTMNNIEFDKNFSSITFTDSRNTKLPYEFYNFYMDFGGTSQFLFMKFRNGLVDDVYACVRADDLRRKFSIQWPDLVPYAQSTQITKVYVSRPSYKEKLGDSLKLKDKI